MAFEKVNKPTFGTGLLVNTVKVASAGKSNQIKFSVSKDIADAMGIAAGSKVDIFAGTELDRGKVAVVKSRNGSGYSVFRSGKGVCVNFGITATRLGLAQPKKPMEAEFSVAGENLIVDCRPLLP